MRSQRVRGRSELKSRHQAPAARSSKSRRA
jgi:hypothetical protein